MEVDIRLFATVREAVGERTLTRTYEDAVTVRDVLRDLEETFPDAEGTLLDDGEIRRSLTVLRNGRNVAHYAGADTELEAGDTLSLTPPVSGG